MSSDYTKKVLKIILGQLCQAIGFHSIQQSTLDVLTSIFDQYLRTLTNQSGKYAEHGNRSSLTIRDVELTFDSMNIDITGLFDYLKNFASIPCIIDVPRYPLLLKKQFNPIPKFSLKRSHGDTVPILMKQVKYEETGENFKCVIDKSLGRNKMSIKRVHFVEQMNKYNMRKRK